jgi:hypothetical protein
MKKTVVFCDLSFPCESALPDERTIGRLRQRCEVADAAGLAAALASADVGVFVHLHGSHFPKAAWPAILAHARAGKGIVALGGAPFRIPVSSEGGAWRAEPEQTAYHRQLHIHEALRVDPAPIDRLVHNPDLPLFRGRERLFAPRPTYGLVLHATHADDCPGQSGSAGPMDAHLYPLLKGIGGGEAAREVAAPAVLLEHTKGEYAGGRWLLVNQPLGAEFWCEDGIAALEDWIAFAAAGVTEMWLKPTSACYEPGDRASLTLQAQRLARDDSSGAPWTLRLRVWKARQSAAAEPDPSFRYPEDRFERVWTEERTVTVGREIGFERIRLPFAIEPGFYAVECEASCSRTVETRTLRQGFWGMDAELLRSGERLTVGRDYFEKGGRPFPVVGMTYMTSDVARKYLFLPNAAVWDRDMAQMKRAGINLIRTGIWTAWRQIMFVDGHAYEETLRAIDAFLLTAKRHDLEVTFNFFAFTPETWEGVNPYLDPRSVEAQKRFVAAIVSRHAETANVHWDLINEPSLFDPRRIFRGPRTAGDKFEREAFIRWLRERHGDIRLLQERWNMTPDELPSFEAVRLPEPEDIPFNTTETREKKGGPWLDYTLFTMAMHNRWAKALAETIRGIRPDALITVGQDEGLGGQRPSPFFYAEAVDYTTVHTWWRMDDLVWDSVFGKAPDKPTLIQETGIMYVEAPDGRAKRSERELRNILERKYAYAFAAGGAGAVQWIWNINFYMDNVNESHIGALRADGTEKPEAGVSYDFGAFIGSIRGLFRGRRLEETAIVFPYANDFSHRPLANEATSRAVRTLAYRLNAHPRGLGEYHLASLADEPPKLILVPSPHNFSDAALNRLAEQVRVRGGVLLFTGPVGLDEYWRPTSRWEALLGAGEVVNLLREELLEIGGKTYAASFGGSRIADSFKQRVRGAAAGGPSPLVEVPLGAGVILWCPLPMELNQDEETLAALYRYALNRAGVRQELEWLAGGGMRGVYGRKVAFAEGSLFAFVSECGSDAELAVKDPDTGAVYRFLLESERSVLFAADRQGRLLSVYRPQEVRIRTEQGTVPK